MTLPAVGPAPFRGVYVPLITPFAADGAVDSAALDGLARRALADGAAGLVALGTTGEPAALTGAERREVTAVIAAACREHGAQLIVGAHTPGEVAKLGELAEREAAEAAARGQSGGLHVAALSLVPPFVRPGEEGVVAHFAALAAAAPVQLIVYHVPARTGQALSAAALRRVLSLPGVAGIKYAVGGVDAAAIELCDTERPTDAPSQPSQPARPPYAVLCGDDAFFAPMLALGAQGGILASSHLATGAYVRLVQAWSEEAQPVAVDPDLARHRRRLGARLAALSAALFAEPNPTVIKALLHARGLIPTAAVRLPLLPAGPDSLRAAEAALADLDELNDSTDLDELGAAFTR